jgi:hypothetical protein
MKNWKSIALLVLVFCAGSCAICGANTSRRRHEF